MQLSWLTIAAVFSFLCVAHTAAVPPSLARRDPGQAYNLTSASTCSKDRANLPEFAVAGETNLYWTFCISVPKSDLNAQDVDALIGKLLNVFHQRLPPSLPLNRYRDTKSPSGTINLGIGPAALGGGPLDRHDPNWFIPNRVVAQVLGDLRNLVRSQLASEVYAAEVFIYEKSIPPFYYSRGTVVSGKLEKRSSGFENSTNNNGDNATITTF